MRDRHTRQATATHERTIADGSDGIANRHARQTRAAVVFATYCLSVSSD